LQILFYYDIIVGGCGYSNNYLLNFYSGLSMCTVTAWIIQDCGAVIKMTQLRFHLRSCWLSWVWLWLRSSLF